MIYLTVFSLSTLSSFFAHRKKTTVLNNTQEKRILWIFLAVFSVSLLAGLRAETIGTDVLVYGNNVFYNMINASSIFSYYANSIDIFQLEPFYIFVNYIVSRVTDVYWGFYLVLAILINGAFYGSVVVLRDKIYPSVSWLIYLLFFYSYTLNIMRQSLATALMVLAIALLIKSKNKLAMLFLVLSILSHYSTGLVAVGLCIVFYLFKKVKNPIKLLFVFSTISLFVVIGIKPLSQLLLNLNILPDRYSIYFTGERDVGFSLNSFVLKLPLIVYYSTKIRKIRRDDYLAPFFFLMLILDFLFYQLRIVNIVFSRLSFYFGVFQMFSFPYLLKEYVTESKEHKYAMLLYIGYLLVIWIYQIVYVGINEIYPYVSIFW